MKKLTLIFLLISISNLCFSQSPKKLKVFEHNFEIGNDYSTGLKFKTRQYQLPSLNILDSRLYPEQEMLIIQTGHYNSFGGERLKTSVYGYDIASKKTVWRTTASNFWGEKVYLGPKDVIINKFAEVLFHDIQSGRVHTFMLERQFAFEHQPTRNAIFIDTNSSKKEGEVYIHSLDSYLPMGEKVTIPAKYGIHEIIHFGDSAAIVSSEGLHYLNFENYKTWSILRTTGYFDVASTILVGLVGIASGLTTGVYFVPISTNEVYGINSNVLLSDDHLFYSSRKSLIKADLHGNVIWDNTNLKLGRSRLFDYGNRIAVIDLGYAFRNWSLAKISEPRIIIIDKENGGIIYQHYINDGIVFDVMQDDNQIHTLTKNKILSFDLEINKVSEVVRFESKFKPNLNWKFENETMYEFINNELISLNELYEYDFLIHDYTRELVIALDDKAEEVISKSIYDIYVYHGEIGELKIYKTNGILLFADQANRIIAELPAFNNFKIEDYKVYSWNEINIWVSDISGLFPDFRSMQE